MNLLEVIHGRWIAQRRVRVLGGHLAALLPPDIATVLDVGCGDGRIARAILEQRPPLRIEGIDVLVRPKTCLRVAPFDGQTIPYPDKSFDAVLLVDVLHHTADPLVLLRESARVARQAVVIKDHYCDGFLAGPTLRFMDRVGNARHRVALPYNYWSAQRWANAFSELNFKVAARISRLGLYPFPAAGLFERGLHFIVRLEVPKSNPPAAEGG